MSNILLQKLVNNELNFDIFKKWLLSQETCPDFKCSQNEFLTYFLNFVHEEINNQKKFGDHTSKCTPRKIKPEQRCSNSLDKSASFPQPSVRSLDKSFGQVSIDSNTSTPKASKIQSDTQLNRSYYSPVSPLYKEEKQGICLGDFLVKKSAKKKVILQKFDDSSRRITPTTLNVRANESFKTINSFNNFNTKEIVSEDSQQNRLFLAKERLKILSRKDSDDSSLAVGSRLSVSEIKEEIEPRASLVTFQNEIDVFSGIYTVLIKHNLVLNIAGEIYFLTSLLLLKVYSADSTEDSQLGVDFLNDSDVSAIDLKCKISDYFETVHNIVYFSVKCLESLSDILKYYDKSTLKSLSANKRVIEYSPKFSEKLRKISEKKSERIVEIVEGNPNVHYNLDTDAKNNFSSEISFLSFRKQRDLFYEILRIWEKNHHQPEWSFHLGLGGKIRTLLSLQTDSANFMHFARLFKAQLLSSCGKFTTEEDENDAVSINFPAIDPSKLNRLKNRLVTRQSTNNSNALPNFVGHQEFYKEFIMTASNHTFNVHLCDTFISEIVELNKNGVNFSGLGESGADVDESMRKSYSLNLRYLRVLAKFLGYVESIPYTSDTKNYPENMFNHHVKIREKKSPPMDVKEILIESIKHNNVVLTIPWLVNYISMLDYITLRLPYYISVYEILFQVYHSYEKSSKNFDYNASLVKFCLGWLFDLPHFPDTEYLKFCANRNAHFIRKSHTLDDLAIVDQTILYSCCPYLEEIKKMLTCSSEYCGVTVKHITPVTAVESSEQISKKRLEQQLEEAFLNGQPESVRKTVEFVSERIASASVKHICTSIVPHHKKRALEEIRKFIETEKKDMLLVSPGRERNQKTVIRTKAIQLSQEKLSKLQDDCAAELSDILADKLSKSIDSLLAVDTLPQSRSTCVSITSRMCRDRIKRWMNSHLTANLFVKDVDKEIQRTFNADNRKTVEEKLVFALPSSGRKENHDDGTLSGFHATEKLKGLAVRIIEKSVEIDRELLMNVLLGVYESLNGRCDLNDVIICQILNLLLDLALLLIAHRPDLMPVEPMTREFVKIWHHCSNYTSDTFNNLLCPKNVTLLQESSNPKEVWGNFAIFASSMVEEKLISCDNFEGQCTAFFRKDWDQSIVDNVCHFMDRFVQFYKQNGGDCGKFTLVLEFLSEFFTEV